MQQQSAGSAVLNTHRLHKSQCVKGGAGLAQQLQLLHRLKRGTIHVQDELQIQLGETLRDTAVHLLIVVRLQCRQGAEATHRRDGTLHQTLKLRLIQLHGNQRPRSLQSLAQRIHPAFQAFQERLQQVTARSCITDGTLAAG